MYATTREEFNYHKAVLFRHYVDPYHATSGVKENEKKRKMNIDGQDRQAIQTRFINSYFARFLKGGGESEDHFDLSKTQYDTYGIPQDMSKRYYAIAQLTDIAVPSSLSHIPLWLARHFQYAVQLSLDFLNDLKFKKLRELRKLQRELPICERKNEILSLIQRNQVMIIAGDTGCGKSTQVPQYLLESGYSGIACTQPRRIACTALARRVAYETLNTYGSEVAYQIRFETTKSQKTKMLFLTEGLLLRQMEQDSLLNQYDIIILDEVHERHLSSDLLIGLLRDLVEKRPDLKLILMSATINLDLFSNYFPGAPVIQVPGRLFPIKLIYRPIKQFINENEKKKTHKIDPQPFIQVLELIDKEYPSTERGDALIFLNGVAEITTVAESLKTYAEMTKGWIILLLHSTLSVEEQDKVFDVAPPGVRKCILSTNIAETSVTIDGIRFVIDSGKVNHIKYDPSTGTQKLCEFWVSKASANQRKGRAGRTGPGICYRLYSEEQFNKLDDFTLSEINRVSLQDMILRMISLNLALDPKTFPFIERPSDDALNEAIEVLKFQGVVYTDRPNELTALGNTIAKIPVEVPIAKMLVFGCITNLMDVMLTIAAGLSVQSPFISRSYRELSIVKKRESLTSRLGDPFTLITVFREWVDNKTGGGQARRWAHEQGIDEHRLYEISKLRNQYKKILEDAGLIDRPIDVDTLDSRQRRIDAGDRRKLFDMKKESRNKDKQRKVLRADKHFDDLFAPEAEEDETDPMKADVHTVEFLLSHKHKDVGEILKSHKLRSRDIQVIRAIITVGLYPNYALLDPFNKYQQGQELFVHTRMKPFSQIHPNSAIAQYHAETLDAHMDDQGCSTFHQVLSFGLLLETTKSYVCNVLPIPMLAILLAAKKVVCNDWTTIYVDDFLEIIFNRDTDCMDTMKQVREIRREMNKGLTRKLRGAKFEYRNLRNLVNDFFDTVEKNGILIQFKRLVEPSKELENPGFYEPEGKVELDEDEEIVQLEELGDANEERIEDTPADPMCPLTRDQIEIQEEKAERTPVEQKLSYYELLLKRQKEKEGNEPAEKRIKSEDGL